MDSNVKSAINNILTSVEATEDEKSLINYSNTPRTDEINHSKVISTFLLTKQLNKSTKEIIESNQKLAKSQEDNSKKMFWLTCALIFVGVVQTVAMIIGIFK